MQNDPPPLQLSTKEYIRIRKGPSSSFFDFDGARSIVWLEKLFRKKIGIREMLNISKLTSQVQPNRLFQRLRRWNKAFKDVQSKILI